MMFVFVSQPGLSLNSMDSTIPARLSQMSGGHLQLNMSEIRPLTPVQFFLQYFHLSRWEHCSSVAQAKTELSLIHCFLLHPTCKSCHSFKEYADFDNFSISSTATALIDANKHPFHFNYCKTCCNSSSCYIVLSSIAVIVILFRSYFGQNHPLVLCIL